MIRVVVRAKKLLLKITIVGYIKALSPIVYNEEKCKRRERERELGEAEEDLSLYI